MFALLYALERSNVLFSKLTERVNIECTSEEEVKVASCIEALAVQLLNCFEVCLVEVSQLERSAQGIMTIKRSLQRVWVSLHRLLFSIFKACAQHGDCIVITVNIVARSLETEVDKLKECTQVLRSWSTRDILCCIIQVNTTAYLLTSQFLLQLSAIKVAHTDRVHYLRHQLCIDNILCNDCILTAEAASYELHLRVVVVSFLKEYASAIW